MRSSKRLISVVMVLFLVTALAAVNAGAAKEQFPTKPITLIVPFSAGGISDIMARNIAETSRKYIQQPINVINRPGGSATIGTYEMITSKPDGYTLLYGSSGELASGLHLVKAPYGLNDYTPLCQIGSMRAVLAVAKDTKWKNLKEFVKYAKANPGKVTVGIPGKGTVVHLTGEYFAQVAGIELNFVPFQGSGPLIPALLGGHVEAALLNVPEIMGMYKAKEAGILAVFSDDKVEAVKEAPLAKKQGFNIAGGASHFIAAPNGLSNDTANAIRKLMKKITSDPKFLEITNGMGYSVSYNGNTKECQKFLNDWYQTGGEVYKKLGMVQQ